jgi:hypothetical protein
MQRSVHWPCCIASRQALFCTAVRPACCHPPQLTPTPGSPIGEWSAAAWIGATRSAADPATWTSSGSGGAALPWCPGEPNNKQGGENCAAMLTACTAGRAGAAVNDYPCDELLRVMCAFTSPDCGAQLLQPAARCLVAASHRRQCSSSRRQMLSRRRAHATTAGLIGLPSSGTTDGPSACAGTTKLVLHSQALTQDEAAEFCRQQHGPEAGLPSGSAPVIAAARKLVETSQVCPCAHSVYVLHLPQSGC